MKNIRWSVGFLLIVLFVSSSTILAQNEPVMYFCKKYGSNGEVGISNRFPTGHITVMVKSDHPLNLEQCSIQFDKWDGFTAKFVYYKKFKYTLEKDMKYVFFAKSDENDLSFDDPGFYRVFLLNDDDETVANALIEIKAN